MAKFSSFEDIQAWQESRVLLKAIRGICKRKSVYRDYSFVDQITRSTRSISANIAEGFDAMTNPEFIQFLGYAKRSCAETKSHLYDALDENYISNQEFTLLTSQAKQIGAMLAKLIRYLQTVDNKQKRTSPLANQELGTRN